jgi:hypothetical protein
MYWSVIVLSPGVLHRAVFGCHPRDIDSPWSCTDMDIHPGAVEAHPTREQIQNAIRIQVTKTKHSYLCT